MTEETKEILDLRRADLRGNVLSNAYWITSAEINKDADQLAALLFSFPIGVDDVNDIGAAYGRDLIVVHEVILEVITAFVGGTSPYPNIMIGRATIATDDITTGGDVTFDDAYPLYDEDVYLGKSDVTLTTAGWYGNGSFGMKWQNSRKGQIIDTFTTITPVDATVRCVVAHVQGHGSSELLTAGRARLHMMISRVPSMARD